MNDNFVPTNTMASAPFDVLKMDGIEDPLINVNKLATMDLEESYFALAVEYLKECNKEITDSKMILYKSISEAENQYVILESFSDFFTKISAIIDKFLQFIKSLFQRFITTLMKMVSSDKYIIKHKKELGKFKSEDEFDFDGYEYTFAPNIPLASAALEFNQNLLSGLYGDEKGAITANSVKDSLNALNLEDDYDLFRARVLSRPEGERITIDEFSNELFMEFRNGTMDSNKITIDSGKVRQCLNRFENYKATKSSVEHTLKDITRTYEAIKKDVSNITKNNGNLNMQAFINMLPDSSNINAVANAGITMSAELMSQIDLYVKAKIDQITEYSNIHTLAFSAKLDALKSCYKQDRAILYKALSKVERTDSKREVK